MNAVGIDVSKGKSMVSVVRPFGELVTKPYKIRHTSSELRKLANSLTSNYYSNFVIFTAYRRFFESSSCKGVIESIKTFKSFGKYIGSNCKKC